MALHSLPCYRWGIAPPARFPQPSLEPPIRVRPKVDLCRHTGTDAFQLTLAKVRQHIPFSRIEEIKNVRARMRIEPFRDVKSHDLAIKRRINLCITEIELGLL
jgi:hypothetical protein